MDLIEEDPVEDEESTPTRTEKKAGSGLNLKAMGPQGTLVQKLKNQVLTAITQLLEDIEEVPEQIAAQAKEHIHSNDVVLTYGHSSRVLTGFFQEAVKDIFFEIVVCETAPSYSG